MGDPKGKSNHEEGNIQVFWGEWPNELRCWNQNRKFSGSNPTRPSPRLRDPTSSRGSRWPSGRIFKNSKNGQSWLWGTQKRVKKIMFTNIAYHHATHLRAVIRVYTSWKRQKTPGIEIVKGYSNGTLAENELNEGRVYLCREKHFSREKFA